MKSIINLILLSILTVILHSCANITPPTGGPQDIAPPEVVSVIPEDKTVNFTGKTVLFSFNEPIQTQNLAENFYISPSLGYIPEVKVRKSSIQINFSEGLKQNTTYTVYLKEVVKDITEGNAIKNLVYTFSTGPFIDSIYIAGKIKNLKTNIPEKNVLVSLYDANDTTSITKDKPLYFSFADKEGIFLIPNIKEGTYDLFALQDQNRNMIYDQENENIAFKKNIELKESIPDLNLYTSKIDTTKPKITAAKSNQEIFTINLSEGVREINVLSAKKYPFKISSTGKEVHFYNSERIFKDSIPIELSLVDSIGNINKTSLKLIFEEMMKDGEKQSLISYVEPQNRKLDPENLSINLYFSHPIEKITRQIQTIPGKIKDTTWNESRTKLKLNLEKLQKDTLILFLPDSTFKSIEDQYSYKDSLIFTTIESRETGSIEGKIENLTENIIIELLNDNFDVIESIPGQENFKFTNLLPGSYYIRITIDKNDNKQWDQANLQENVQPEPIIFHKEQIKIKANWEIKGITIKL